MKYYIQLYNVLTSDAWTQKQSSSYFNHTKLRIRCNVNVHPETRLFDPSILYFDFKYTFLIL